MNGIHIVSLSIKGIKSLDNEVSLSFYKKDITPPYNFRDYNIKGVYGTNGSGKTAIVSAVKILKDIMLNSDYLSSDINQKKLHELVNKKTRSMHIEVEYLIEFGSTIKPILYRCYIEIGLNKLNKFRIVREKLEYRTTSSRSSKYNLLYDIDNGALKLSDSLRTKTSSIFNEETKNLLTTSSLCSLFYVKILTLLEDVIKSDIKPDMLILGCLAQLMFYTNVYVYLEDKDLHDEYIINEMLSESKLREYIDNITDYKGFDDQVIVAGINYVDRNKLKAFKAKVRSLGEFLKIFKNELQDVEIDKRVDGDLYICRLIMKYDGYKIDSEYESSGIKKLIDLFDYIKKMNDSGIVFIDEFDANLHDVYLCVLLEYLSEYAEGQLCFTSHNIGPMRVLKSKKRSLDFLSVDRTIYSWSASGNYSPTTLYCNGMIEGSPFNVYMTDFLGVFDESEENE